MFDDPDEPSRKTPPVRNLDTMSLADLGDYVAELRAEIVRVETEMTKKEAHANTASFLFKPVSQD